MEVKTKSFKNYERNEEQNKIKGQPNPLPYQSHIFDISWTFELNLKPLDTLIIP
jgi:hypothetical protein